MALDSLPAVAAEFGRFVGVIEQMNQAFRALLVAVNEILFIAHGKLHGNSPGRTRHDGFLLPKGFRDDQSESFTQGFLDDQVGPSLENVDFHVSDASQIGENVQIAILQ